MKKYLNLTKLAVIALAIVAEPSCQKDFLKETLKTDRSTEFAKTDQGILQLAAGAYYQAFSVPTNGEWFYCATNYGTDEFRIGGDPSNSPWNNYDQTFNSIVTVVNGNTAASNFQWDELYKTIGNANLLIENATKSTSTSTAIKSTALGEGYFIRAYSYLRLVSQYGAVPLQLEPLSTVKLDFTRTPAKDVYAQIIADLLKAKDLLPSSGAPAKITKNAANHFLAKAYLFRASEINSAWNSSTLTADLTAAVTLAD